MSVLSMMRVQGDADELAAGIRDHLDPVAERLAPKHGGLLNIVARDKDGLIMINLWETEEGRHEMAEEPEIREAVRASGLPEPHFDGYEVLWMHVSERVQAMASA